MDVSVTSQQWGNQRVIVSLQRALSKRRKADLQEAMETGNFGDINSDETAVRYRSIIHESILDFKKYFQGVILRRTLESKRRDGTVLVALPPLHQIQVWVKLSKQHENALTGVTKSAVTRWVFDSHHDACNQLTLGSGTMAPKEYGVSGFVEYQGMD